MPWLPGYGTVRVVLVIEVARTWPSKTPLRVKLIAGRPKPKLAKPFPVSVKLVGGEARSIGLGVIELTEVVKPVTVTDAPAPPVNVTLPANVPADIGVKRTVTVWLCPLLRLYVPPDRTE